MNVAEKAKNDDLVAAAAKEGTPCRRPAAVIICSCRRSLHDDNDGRIPQQLVIIRRRILGIIFILYFLSKSNAHRSKKNCRPNESSLSLSLSLSLDAKIGPVGMDQLATRLH